MAIRKILHYPDPRLRRTAQPVKRVDAETRTLVDDMAETMYDAPGIGLAAPQVDVVKRVIVIDISETRDDLRVFINPQIVARDGQQTLEEGCLSVPGIYDNVTRAEHVTVRAQGRDGKLFELEVSGLLASCVQHEIDHLEGKLFVDYLSRLKQQRVRKKLEKQQRLAM
ncbi:MAG: peptide deformylase [Gammaproteobacteria bacterium]|nr:MAG: peptide deformylase [Gammaproteobacteria bacterium]